MKTVNEKIHYVRCRRTGCGAYTSANGKVVERSGTGNHWTESVVLTPGKKIPVVDISNSGKHNCYYLLLDENGNVTTEPKTGIECSICWKQSNGI